MRTDFILFFSDVRVASYAFRQTNGVQAIKYIVWIAYELIISLIDLKNLNK